MRHDRPRQPRRPGLTRGELALMVLGGACVVGQAIVYRGPNPGTSARVAVIALGLATFGSFFALVGLVVRRARRRGFPADPLPPWHDGHRTIDRTR